MLYIYLYVHNVCEVGSNVFFITVLFCSFSKIMESREMHWCVYYTLLRTKRYNRLCSLSPSMFWYMTWISACRGALAKFASDLLSSYMFVSFIVSYTMPGCSYTIIDLSTFFWQKFLLKQGYDEAQEVFAISSCPSGCLEFCKLLQQILVTPLHHGSMTNKVKLTKVF